MDAAGIAAGPSGRMAGRLQTVVVIAVTAVVIGVAAVLVGGTKSDGVTAVELTGDVAAAAPAVGGTVPNFTGVTYDGKKFSLADYAGKPMWLTFGASWCPDCRSEAADVQAVYDKYRPQGLVLVGVFIRESASDIGGFAQRAGLTFPIVVDSSTVIASAYRNLGLPTHYFIGADGKIREIRIGALHASDMDAAVAAIVH
jgi:cytochrome c biogenesis protein CcmG, thiol:disulfide interchange protein DsbE